MYYVRHPRPLNQNPRDADQQIPAIKHLWTHTTMILSWRYSQKQVTFTVYVQTLSSTINLGTTSFKRDQRRKKAKRPIRRLELASRLQSE